MSVSAAILSKLSATSGVTSACGTRIFFDVAPDGTQFPFVIFSKQAGTKTRAFQTPEAFKREVWMIKCVDRGSSSVTAETVAAAIDAAFDGGTLSVAGKTLADLHHTADLDYLETVGDQTYRHHGRSFAVVLTA